MNILITHANTPYFNKAERDEFILRMSNILDYLKIADVDVAIRSHENFLIKYDPDVFIVDNNTAACDLHKKYDLVVSTPSTILLEFFNNKVPVFLLILRSGPPNVRSAFMSFREDDDIKELSQMVASFGDQYNPRLLMQNNCFSKEYIFGTKFYDIDILKINSQKSIVPLEERLKSKRNLVLFFSILEVFVSSLARLIRRRRF